jgi:hypothetical protein
MRPQERTLGLVGLNCAPFAARALREEGGLPNEAPTPGEGPQPVGTF